jgi:hypothetical protein
MKLSEKTFFINRKKPVVGPLLTCKTIYAGTGSAPACHGKLSEFESRHPSKIKNGHMSKAVPDTFQPAQKNSKKLVYMQLYSTIHWGI